MADGLSVERAAKAVGYSRATLYLWQKCADLRSPSKRDPAVSYVLSPDTSLTAPNPLSTIRYTHIR